MAYSKKQIQNKLERIIKHLEAEKALLMQSFEESKNNLISVGKQVAPLACDETEDVFNQVQNWKPDSVPLNLFRFVFGGGEIVTSYENALFNANAEVVKNNSELRQFLDQKLEIQTANKFSECEKSVTKRDKLIKEKPLYDACVKLQASAAEIRSLDLKLVEFNHLSVPEYKLYGNEIKTIMDYKLPPPESLFKRFFKWAAACINSMINYVVQENPNPQSLKAQVKATLFTASNSKPCQGKASYLSVSKYMGWSGSKPGCYNKKETKPFQEQLTDKRLSMRSALSLKL